MGNAFVFVVGECIIFKDSFPISLLVIYSIFSYLAFVLLFALDAIPPDILSHKRKAYCTLVIFIMSALTALDMAFYSSYERQTGKTWEFYLGWKKWDLLSIIAGCIANITLFVGRMFWTSFNNPGYYTIIRSMVKQKSLVPLTPDERDGNKIKYMYSTKNHEIQDAHVLHFDSEIPEN